MESWTSAERREWPGKTVSPRPSKLKAWAYKDFKIGELFSAQTGDTDLQQKDINGKGVYFINSGVEAQGIKGKTDRAARVFGCNTITIDFWGNAYYRDFEYKMATHNHVFSLSGKVIKNSNVGLYLVTALSYLKNLFSYNNMGTWSKIKKQIIHLPITQTGDIDFTFMESRIREMEESRIREMEAYLKVAGFEDCELTEEERAAQPFGYKYYRIGDLFDIHPTKAYKLNNAEIFDKMGSNPVVCNSSINNGIAGYSALVTTEKGNMVTFSDTTTSESIFYQPDDYVGYPHVQGLYNKNRDPWSETTYLYFLTTFRKCAFGRFDYATKFTRVIASNMMVRLPVTPTGAIDYHFMETYIRAIEKQTIQRIKDWRTREITATKGVVNGETHL